MEYLELQMELSESGEDTFLAHILASPQGEGQEEVPALVGHPDVPSLAASVEGAVLHPDDIIDGRAVTGRQFVDLVGSSLFQSLFRGSLRGILDSSLSKASQQSSGLRLRLRTKSLAAALYPWEFMVDDNGHSFALRESTPVLRYPELGTAPESLEIDGPLRILGMVASPVDQETLDVERERGLVEDAVRDIAGAEIHWIPGTWQSLFDALPGDPWHVFHFIGHGAFSSEAGEGYIALEDEQGKTRLLSGIDLARMLAEKDSLRLAVLNSCQGGMGGNADRSTSVATHIVRLGTPAVISMQFSVSDQTALEFARTFYSLLGAGYPVDAALSRTRLAISVSAPGSREWATPVLHMRSTDGVLFRRPVGHPPTQSEAEHGWFAASELTEVGRQHFRWVGHFGSLPSEMLIQADEVLRRIGARSVEIRPPSIVVGKTGLLPFAFAASEEVQIEVTADLRGGSSIAISSRSIQFVLSDGGRNEANIRQCIALLGGT